MDANAIAFWSFIASAFAAVGTVGTLVLAVLILAADRRRSVSANADSLVTWLRIKSTRAAKNKPDWVLVVNAYNAGDRPIPFSMIVPKPGDNADFPGIVLQLTPIAPGETAIREVPLEDDPRRHVFWLWFRDARSKSWFRDLQANKYVSKREIRSLYRKYKDDPLKSIHILFPTKRVG